MTEKVARPQFPTKDGMWQPSAILWKQICAVYGGRLVEIECQNINLWLVKHSTSWKTARGMPRFLNTWFGRASKCRPIAQTLFQPGVYRGPEMEGPTKEEIARMQAARRVM